MISIIHPSFSPCASPLHLAPQLSDDWRPCGDCLALNKTTVPDQYPIPSKHEFANWLSSQNSLFRSQLVNEYHQIPVVEGNIPKTAVMTPVGLFEFTRMLFGLRNAVRTSQRFVGKVLHRLSFEFVHFDYTPVTLPALFEYLGLYVVWYTFYTPMALMAVIQWFIPGFNSHRDLVVMPCNWWLLTRTVKRLPIVVMLLIKAVTRRWNQFSS